MNLLSCLADILSSFRRLFNLQNFALFQAMICGTLLLIHTVEHSPVFINQVSQRRSPGLGRSFSPEGCGMLILLLHASLKRDRKYSPTGFMFMISRVLSKQVRSAVQTGKKQYGLHFFRNFKYQKGRVNPSKFHFGHEFAALGLLCQTVSTQWILFLVWVRLIVPKKLRDKGDGVLKRPFSRIPRGSDFLRVPKKKQTRRIFTPIRNKITHCPLTRQHEIYNIVQTLVILPQSGMRCE